MTALADFLDALRNRFRDTPVAPPYFDDVEFYGPPQDAEEEPRDKPDKISLEPMALAIRYCDAKGQASERAITCKQIVYYQNSTCIRAYCHMRGALRAFRTDRIECVVEYGTGEVHEPPDTFLDELLTDAEAGGSTPANLDLCRDGLIVLTFLARCDGKFHENEMEAIAEYCRVRLGPYAPDQDIDAALEEARRLYPDADSFLDAAERIIMRDETHARQLLTASRRLIDADSVRHPNEIDFAWELQEIANETF